MAIHRILDAEGFYLEALLVSDSVRGKGYGRRMMEFAHDFARSKGQKTMYLNTKDKVEFYNHLGYKECQPINPVSEVTNFMGKSLDALLPTEQQNPLQTPTPPSAPQETMKRGGPPPPPAKKLIVTPKKQFLTWMKKDL